MINKHVGTKNSMPQMSLYGLGTRPAQTHDYFFALLPSLDVRRHLANCAETLRAAENFNGSWIASERYHLMLHHLGQYPEVRSDLVSRAVTAAGNIQSKPFDIVLDQFMSFDSKTGKFPCAITSTTELTPLSDLWKQLRNNLLAVRLGEKLSTGFRPGVTLLYNRQPLAEARSVAPILWPVSDFVLIASLAGKAEYTELGRWPLSA